MKKGCRPIGSTARLKIFVGVVGLSFMALISASQARANSELDRQYALETVGFLRAWDNMDGLFAEYVSTAYKEFFSKQSRFVLQDLSKADSLFQKTKIPYVQLIEDVEILGQLARSMRSESIIRTKIYKEGYRYRFTIDWLHSPKMELISNETFTIEEPLDGRRFGLGDVKASLQKALAAMIKKVPFVATVTGRDENSITVNIGANVNLKPGDVLVVATLDEVKKHPLLKAIVDWRLTQVGRLEVESVDEGIAFCKIIEEEPGRQVSRYQKVSQIIPKPTEIDLKEREKQDRIINERRGNDDVVIVEDNYSGPALGWFSGGLWVGNFSRENHTPISTTNTKSTGRTGGGLFLGTKADGQLWLTKSFFTDIGFAYGYNNYSQTIVETKAETGTSGVTASLFDFTADLGYKFYSGADLWGPKGWVKTGYKSSSYSLPVSEDERTGPSTYSGPFVGLGADLPVRGRYGALLELNYGVFTSGSETTYAPGTINDSTAVFLYAGGYYRLNLSTLIKAGLDFSSHSLERNNGSLTHRVISFLPSVVFYF